MKSFIPLNKNNYKIDMSRLKNTISFEKNIFKAKKKTNTIRELFNSQDTITDKNKYFSTFLIIININTFILHLLIPPYLFLIKSLLLRSNSITLKTLPAYLNLSSTELIKTNVGHIQDCLSYL